MKAFAMASAASIAMAGGGEAHVSSFTRKFVAAAFVVVLVGGVIFMWWLKSDRDDD
jgi:hypothetical protein